MKERPILFSAAMVRAILEGKKTQTRRVVKPRKDLSFGCLLQPHELAGEVNAGDYMNSHYGKPGDRLWVRESFWGCDMPGYGDQPCVVYDDEWYGKDYRPAEARPWARKFGRIPSIHMPRDCSRINLEITGVRVERLNDINESDARAEGITDGGCTNCGNPEPCGCASPSPDARDSFINLWEQINGPCSWIANPWVWAVEFRRVL